METRWYYAQDGEPLGPMPRAEVVQRIRRRRDQPHFVWTDGMADWRDARTMTQFAVALQVQRSAGGGADARWRASTLAGRARRELTAYLTVSGYLFVWFSALIFYKASILRSVGVEFAPFGIAVVKALILGKFMLLLEALKIGEGGIGRGVVLVKVLKKAVLFTLLLFALTIVEELVVGHLHGREAREVLHEIAGGSWRQALAMAVLMFLLLIPYFAYREIAFRLGEVEVFRFFVARATFESDSPDA
jgi:GYF domain 2